MPSLLSRAAMVALGATGNRRLDTVGPCTHDICGRKLVNLHKDHGDPQILQAATCTDNGVDVGNWDGIQENCQAPYVFTPKSYTLTEITIDPNGINIPTQGINPDHKVSIADGVITAQVHFDSTYSTQHNNMNCELVITPVIDTSGDTEVTSVTFAYNNDITKHNNVDHASVAVARTGCVGNDGVKKSDESECACESIEGAVCKDDQGDPLSDWGSTQADCETKENGDPTGNTFVRPLKGETSCRTVKAPPVLENGKLLHKVSLDSPTISHESLGYLGVDIQVHLECSKLESGEAPAQGAATTGTDADGNAVYKPPFPVTYDSVAGHTYAAVRHTYKEHEQQNLLDYDAAISLSSLTYDYAASAHRNLPATLAGTATLQTQKSAVRFPAGEWATFGTQNPDPTDKTTCSWVYDIDSDFSGQIQIDNWYKNLKAAGEVGAPKHFFYEPNVCSGAEGCAAKNADQNTCESENKDDDPATPDDDESAYNCVWEGQAGVNGISNDVLGDTNECEDESLAGVACARKHEVSLAWNTALGFEVPLPKYFEGTCAVKEGGTNADCAAAIKAAACDAATTSGGGNDPVANACVFTPAMPKIECVEHTDPARLVAASESEQQEKTPTNAKIDGSDSHALLGQKKATLVFSAKTITEDEIKDGDDSPVPAFGEQYFDGASDKLIFDDTAGLFEIAQSANADWYDLTAPYDYQFAVKYDNQGEGSGELVAGAASSGDSGIIANLVLQGKCDGPAGCAENNADKATCEDVTFEDNAETAGVDESQQKCTWTPAEERGVEAAAEALAAKVSDFKSDQIVIRPTLYGQTRTHYVVAQDFDSGACAVKANGDNENCAAATTRADCDAATTSGGGNDPVANACEFTPTGVAQNNVQFRRKKAEISLDLTATVDADGKIKYDGAEDLLTDTAGNVVNFDGSDEPWDTTLGSAQIKSENDCTYCNKNRALNTDVDAVLKLTPNECKPVDGENADCADANADAATCAAASIANGVQCAFTAGTPNPTYDLSAKTFDFFKALDNAGATVAELFDGQERAVNTCGQGSCSGHAGCPAHNDRIACEAASLGQCKGQVVETPASCVDDVGDAVNAADAGACTQAGGTYTPAVIAASDSCDAASSTEAACTSKTDEGGNSCVWVGDDLCTFTANAAKEKAWCASSTGGRPQSTCVDEQGNPVTDWDSEVNSAAECTATSGNAYNPSTAFQCKDQSVTYTLTVGKADEDDRVHDTETVTKLYEDAKDVTSAGLPVVTSEADLFILAGTAPVGTIQRTATYPVDDENSPLPGEGTIIDAIDFALVDTDAREYNAMQQKEPVHYQAEYREPCTFALTPIPHTINHCVAYSVKQVQPRAYSNDVLSDGTAIAPLTEHSLQRNENAIEFYIDNSADSTFGLKFTDSLEVSASYKTWLATVKKVADRDAAMSDDTGGCYLEIGNTRARCIINTFKDADFDKEFKLRDDVACGGSGENAVACPQVTLEVSQKFNVPDFGTSALATAIGDCAQDTADGAATCDKVALSVSQAECSQDGCVWTQDDELSAFLSESSKQVQCESTAEISAQRHVIGSGTIDIAVVGSDSYKNMYSNEFILSHLKRDGNGDYGTLQQLASASTDNGDDSVGADGEYVTTLASDSFHDGDGKLQAQMDMLRLQVKIFGDKAASDADAANLEGKVRYLVQNHANDKYNLANCKAYGLNEFDDCETKYKLNVAQNKNQPARLALDTVGPDGTRTEGVFNMIIDDVTGSGLDPCEDDMLGAGFAFGTRGIEIGITKEVMNDDGVFVAAGQEHVYTIPIKCHTESSAAAVRSDVNVVESANSGAWYLKTLTVPLTGSSIDEQHKVAIRTGTGTGQASVLSKDAEGTIVKAAGDAYPSVQLDLSYNDNGCSGTSEVTLFRVKGTEQDPNDVAVLKEDGTAFTYTLQCPQNNFGISGIDANAVHSDNDPVFVQFGDIFVLRNVQIQGRVGPARGTPLTLSKATLQSGARVSSTGQEIVFYDGSPDGTSQYTIEANELDGSEGSGDLTFQILNGKDSNDNPNDKITCRFITVELSSKTTDDATNGGTVRYFKFDVPCPRTRYAAARTDKLTLDYDITGISFGQKSSSIQLPAIPAGQSDVTSTIALGRCNSNKQLTVASEDDTGTCAVDTGGVNQACAGKTTKDACSAASVDGGACVFTPAFPDTASENYGTCKAPDGDESLADTCDATDVSQAECLEKDATCVFETTVRSTDVNACSLSVGENILDDASDGSLVASDVMRLFDHCGGEATFVPNAAGVGEFAGSMVLEATAYVARSYAHQHSVAGAFSQQPNYFCQETPIRIQAMSKQDKSAIVTVAAAQDMEFEVQITELDYETCNFNDGDDDANDGLRMTTTIAMSSKLGTSAYSNNVQTYYRSASSAGGNTEYSFYKQGNDGLVALSDAQTEGDSTLIVQGPCQDKDDANFDDSAHTITYTMLVESNEIIYFAEASVVVQISKPQDEFQRLLDFSAEDLSIAVACKQSGEDFDTGCVDANGDSLYSAEDGGFRGIPADYNIRAIISVEEDEKSAFDHTFSSPIIKTADTVAELADASFSAISGFDSSYKAFTGVAEELISESNTVVKLAGAAFAGKALEIQWTVTRVEKARRLRQLLTVSYRFGADGSVDKAVSLAVAPAIRESGEQPAQTQVRQSERVEEYDDFTRTTSTKTTTTKEDDGSSTIVTERSTSYVYPDDPSRDRIENTTTTEKRDGENPLEVDNPDHTAAWFGAIAGGVSAVGVLVIAIIYAVKNSGGAKAAVALTPGSNELLWNRNRFAPGDF